MSNENEQHPFDTDVLDEVYGKSINEVLAPMFDVDDSSVLQSGAVVFTWSRPGMGFGQLTFGVRDGKPFIDTESMGSEFAMEVITRALQPVLLAEEAEQQRWWDEQESLRNGKP